MNTTAAATQAGVTAATIRTWCRIGAVVAAKVAGRWVIEAASLLRRIALGKKKTVSLPFNITTKVKTPGADIAVLGEADALKAAYETGAPITLTGKLAGEVVYLGHTRQTYDDGIRLEKVGLDRIWGESPKHPGVTVAAYLVDMTRLDGAPTLAALKKKVDVERLAATVRAEARAEAEDERLENLAEDGA
jgi:hypothetical protein